MSPGEIIHACSVVHACSVYMYMCYLFFYSLIVTESENYTEDDRKGRSGIIRLGSIRDVIGRVSHMITPTSYP